jgi:hypothetical protein
MSEQGEHLLTGPRAAAALGLTGPLGVGVALMAIASPHLNGLFWLGFIISLFGGVGTFWVGFAEIKKRTPLGVIIGGIALVDFVAPIGVLFYVRFDTGPATPPNGADISIEKIELTKIPTSQGLYTFNFYYLNRGNLRANTPSYSAAFALFDHRPTTDDINKMADGQISRSYEIVVPDSIQNVLRVKQGHFDTLWGIEINEQTMSYVLARQGWFTIFIFLKYIDDTTTKGEYLVTERCAWFFGTFNTQEWCPNHNISYRVPSKDHPVVSPPTPKPPDMPAKR